MASAPQEPELHPPVDPITSRTRQRVRAYFEPVGPDRPRQLLYFGVPAMALLIVGTSAGMPRTLVASLALLGVIVFGVGAVLAMRARRRATDAEVDLVRDSDFERAQGLGRERAQLVASDLRHPDGCAFRNSRVERDFRGAHQATKLGDDETTRWTPVDITSVHFGHQQLFVYRCAIDLTTGDALYDTVREISYADIVSVVTHSERLTRPISQKKSADVVGYWEQRGAAIVNDTLQVDGPQFVSLRLMNGEELELARWDGVRDGKQPDEAPAHAVAAARLRARIRAARERTAQIERFPRIVRHPSHDA